MLEAAAYIKERNGTEIWLNNYHIGTLCKNLRVVYRWKDHQDPCLLWIKKTKKGIPSEPRMEFHLKRYSLAPMLFDYCVAPLGAGQRVEQLCGNDEICLQPKHLSKKRKIEKKISLDIIEKPPLSLTDEDVPTIEEIEMASKKGCVLIGKDGAIFTTASLLERSKKQSIYIPYEPKKDTIKQELNTDQVITSEKSNVEKKQEEM